MPDITMCPSHICPLRTRCWRNEASGQKPSERRQSWFLLTANSGPDETEYCNFYWAAFPTDEPHPAQKEHAQ